MTKVVFINFRNYKIYLTACDENLVYLTDTFIVVSFRHDENTYTYTPYSSYNIMDCNYAIFVTCQNIRYDLNNLLMKIPYLLSKRINVFNYYLKDEAERFIDSYENQKPLPLFKSVHDCWSLYNNINLFHCLIPARYLPFELNAEKCYDKIDNILFNLHSSIYYLNITLCTLKDELKIEKGNHDIKISVIDKIKLMLYRFQKNHRISRIDFDSVYFLIKNIFQLIISFLRILRLRLLGAKISYSAKLYGSVRINCNFKNITIGQNVVIREKVEIKFDRISSSEYIFIYENVIIEHGVYLYCEGGGITIGNGAYIGRFCILQGKGTINIKPNVLLGPGVKLFSTNHFFDYKTDNINSLGSYFGQIVIEESCWIGADTLILMNTKIGSHSIVAAGSVIKGKYEKNSFLKGISISREK